jgi:hypothetical protein
MSIQDISAEELARLFDHYQEALAGDFDCSAKHDNAASWEHTPQNERKWKIAAARLALLELRAKEAGASSNRKYFAKPGEAEWGC